MILQTQNLSIGYKLNRLKNKILYQNLNLELQKGELVSLLGVNGAGKSTLLRTLAGVQKPIDGLVLLDNQLINHLKTQHIAQKLSLVLTDKIEIGNFSVRDLVSLGRYPYTGWFGTLSPQDEKIVDWAIQVTEIEQFSQRNLFELSDGERQKVMIARALAQQTPLIFLDEPTAHLDVPNRIMIFQLLKKLAQTTQKTILLATHELDLALQISDKIWLLSPDTQLISGIPEDLILQGIFQKMIFQTIDHRRQTTDTSKNPENPAILSENKGFEFNLLTGAFQIQHFGERKITLQSENPIYAFWTKRALERIGFQVVIENKNSLHLKIIETEKAVFWEINTPQNSQKFTSIQALLSQLKNILA